MFSCKRGIPKRVHSISQSLPNSPAKCIPQAAALPVHHRGDHGVQGLRGACPVAPVFVFFFVASKTIFPRVPALPALARPFFGLKGGSLSAGGEAESHVSGLVWGWLGVRRVRGGGAKCGAGDWKVHFDRWFLRVNEKPALDTPKAPGATAPRIGGKLTVLCVCV